MATHQDPASGGVLVFSEHAETLGELLTVGREFASRLQRPFENAAFDGKMTGNSHIYVVATNDEGVRRLCSLGPQEVKSPVVEWERSSTFQSTTGDCAGR